jgi:DNA processing protein
MSLELYKIALGQLNGIGPSRATRILGKLSCLTDLFTQNDRELHLQTGVALSILKEMNREKSLQIAEKQLLFNEHNKVQSHFFMDEDYPRRLRQCADAPIILFSKGLSHLNQPNVVSIVGTRNQTEYGRKLVEELLETIQSKDLTVISGLAYGVDIHVHETCVAKGIFNIGVFGHSLDRIYPYQHRKVAERMLENGGWISEFIVGTKPDRMNFPMRNRIIAGMSDAIIVVESKTKGGSIITAELGNDYNRDVFAFPGNVHQEQSEGCNWLIQKQKAHLIQNGSDFLTFMNWQLEMPKKQLELFPELEEKELKVFQILVELKEAHIDVIAMKSGLSTSQLNVLLFQLEMKNIVQSGSGKRYSLQFKHCA